MVTNARSSLWQTVLGGGGPVQYGMGVFLKSSLLLQNTWVTLAAHPGILQKNICVALFPSVTKYNKAMKYEVNFFVLSCKQQKTYYWPTVTGKQWVSPETHSSTKTWAKVRGKRCNTVKTKIQIKLKLQTALNGALAHLRPPRRAAVGLKAHTSNERCLFHNTKPKWYGNLNIRLISHTQ